MWPFKSKEMGMGTIAEIKDRIEKAAKKLGLDAQALMREYGVTTALAEMLEREVLVSVSLRD